MDEQAIQKLLSLMGLARRAGKLALGADASVEAARLGTARLLLFASDLSPGTAGSAAKAAPALQALSLPVPMEEMGHRGDPHALADGFARRMLELGREAGAAVTMTGRDFS